MSPLIKHEPYSGSTKQFLQDLAPGDVRIADSRKQALAVHTEARKFNVKTTRKKLADGRYAVRRLN